jgi:hypothetical protein
MQLHTAVKINSYPFKINHKDTLFSLGSCFSDEMGKKLHQSKFEVINNPFGVLFHPLSIENAIDRILNLTHYEPFEIFRHNELYFSWDHSSQFSATTQEETLSKINSRLVEANEKAQEAKVFFITFATSWAYYLKKAELFVANCHKIPNSEFEKVLLSEIEIENAIKKIIDKLNDLPQKIEIIFTVSPVRHLRDGLVENNVSKSRLLNAVYKMTNQHENVHYFPSYEILLDELREYRFFAEDMIHPSQQAIEYIWRKFCGSFFLDPTTLLIQKTKEVFDIMAHKTLHPTTLAYKKQLYDTIKKINALEPYLKLNSFQEESKIIKDKIKNAD